MALQSILVEGWTFVPHSYAIVNQWQCLEILRRARYDLYLKQPPLYNESWQRRRGLLDNGAEEKLAALSPPPSGFRPDAVLRLTVPVDLSPAAAANTFVLGTADFGWLPRAMMKDKVSLKQAHKGNNTYLITPSQWSRWGLIRGGADSKRVAVVPHGVDTDLFKPAEPETRDRLRRELGWQDKFVFLNVSAMTRSKGTDLMLQAFARVAPKYDHAHLMLKGFQNIHKSNDWIKMWWRDKLTAQERNLLQKRITYVSEGYSFARMSELYQAADLYLTPYRSESFNMPALEAIACGLPIICTAGGATDDFVDYEFARRIKSKVEPKNRPDRDPEEIVRVADLDHLTELMIEALEGASYCAAAREAGPYRVKQGFTWQQAVDQLLHVMSMEWKR